MPVSLLGPPCILRTGMRDSASRNVTRSYWWSEVDVRASFEFQKWMPRHVSLVVQLPQNLRSEVSQQSRLHDLHLHFPLPVSPAFHNNQPLSFVK